MYNTPGTVYVGDTGSDHDFKVFGEGSFYGTGNNYFNGSVGIGTTTPTNKLTIASTMTRTPSATNQALMFQNSANGADYYGIMLDDSSRLKITPRAGSSWSPTALSLDQYGNVGVQVNENVGPTNSFDVAGKFVVNGTSGNVGIGTTSPTQKLEVNGSANVTGNMTIGNAQVYTDTSGDMVFRV